MGEVTIRERQPEDLQRCVELLVEVHRFDGYPLNWPADPYQWLSPSGVPWAWVAEAGGAVVGHVAVHAAPAPLPADQVSAPVRAEVGRLFVASAFRRHHVATGLLQQARRWAVEHRADLVLEVVDSRRSAAVALYERTGWQHVHTATASWTAPDGSPVTLRRYIPRQAPEGEI